MALPKLQHPTSEVKIPSTKEKCIIRPYTVKEQKILLMLKESSDSDEIVRTLKDLITSCCNTKINVEKLAYFDLEYLFLQIRAISVGEFSSLSYKCNNIVDDKRCGKVNQIDIDLTSISVDFSGVKPKEVQIQQGISIRLNFPNVESAKHILEYRESNNIDSLIAAIINDVDVIKDSEKIYDDFTKEELAEFLYALPIEAFEKILEFYISCPTLKKVVNFVCSSCGYKEEITLSGVQDFFE
jgi:hypothetical protein